jgi:hypothetical protein
MTTKNGRLPRACTRKLEDIADVVDSFSLEDRAEPLGGAFEAWCRLRQRHETHSEGSRKQSFDA